MCLLFNNLCSMKYLFVFFFLTISQALFTQEKEADFSGIDEWAKKQRYKGNLEQLVTDLTSPYSSEIEKTRAIYTWIIHSIKYDVKTYNKPKSATRFKCINKENCEEEYQEFEQKMIQKVLQKKRAICSGYAKLFCKMSSFAGIPCVEIDGYIKNKPKHAGEMGILDHAWNGITINGAMHFVDATWAAGYCTKGKGRKLRKFIPQQNDFYWFTPTDKFHLDHFPKDVKKVTNLSITENTYKRYPYIFSPIIPLLEINAPKDGTFHARKGDTLYFEFRYQGIISKIQVNSNVVKSPKYWKKGKKGKLEVNRMATSKQVYVPFQKNGDLYQFEYVVPENGSLYFDLLFDHEIKIRFKNE